MLSETLVGDKFIGNSRSSSESKFLLLTSSLLIDRVFLHTNLIPVLKNSGEVIVWATSFQDEKYNALWNKSTAQVSSFPQVTAFREIPHNFMRRINEFTWDFRYQLPSRMSIMRHVRSKNQNLTIRALRIPAKVLAMLRMEQLLEDNLERLLLSYPRSQEAEKRLLKEKPSVIVTTGLFQFEQPAVFAAAKKIGIPTLAYVPSWDNISTKNRMVYKYDGYIVWSEQIKKELHEFYPSSQNVPVYVCGAPQFDILFQSDYYESREKFCAEQGLNPDLPIILYAIGSPNFLQEHHGAIKLAERIARGELGDVQMLVRPHPIHDNAEMKQLFEIFTPRVKLQLNPNAGKTLTERSQDEEQIRDWVNTFRHADVVINLSSTATVDAAIFDVPVINLDFDPQPGQVDQQLIKDINHLWTHFKPIAESNGVWLVNDYDEMVYAVKEYLKNPALHREQRKWVAEYVCGYLDGKCSERMAEAILSFASTYVHKRP